MDSVIVLNDYMHKNNKLVNICKAAAQSVMKNNMKNESMQESLKESNSTIGKNHTNDLTSQNISLRLSDNSSDNNEEVNSKEGILKGHSDEEEKFTWGKKSTQLFLDEYSKRIADFRDPQIKKKTLWDDIRNVMNDRGYLVDSDGLDRKMRNMKCTFNKIRENNKRSRTGRRKIFWEYFNQFSEMFAEDKAADVKHIISSLRAKKPTALKLCDEMPELPLNESTSVKRLQMICKSSPASGKLANNGVPIKLNDNFSDNNEEVNTKVDVSKIPKVEDEKFTWGKKSTLLFLDEYCKRIKDFRDPHIRKKMLWDDLRNIMNENGYLVDSDGLDRKMRNMKCTFNKIRENNKKSRTARRKIYWEYYEKFSEMFPEEKTARPSLLATALRPLKPIAPKPVEMQDLSPSDSSPIKRLQVFRKRRIELEESKLEELKKIRVAVEESNKINKDKLNVFKQFVELQRK